MSGGKSDALVAWADIAAALGLLTRLPVPVDGDRAVARGARAAWAWPVAGLAVAVLAALAAETALRLDLPAVVAACVAVAVQAAVTGAMHEDGLADTCDGLWGGWTRERRLEIMRDSHVGTYGVLALILSVAVRVALIAALAGDAMWPALLAAGALSRGAMATAMGALPFARTDGLAKGVGRPGGATVGLALAVAGLAGIALVGWGAVVAALVVGMAAVAVCLIARTRIGGQTGDILGAVQQVSEIAALATLVAML